MESGLEGSVILITGASGGIGQATAGALAAEGARLVLHYHTNESAAKELARSLDTDALPLGADLRDEGSVDRMYATAIERFGGIDGVVVNAGIWPAEHVGLQDMSLARWEGTIAADLTSAFLTCRGFFRHLRDQPRQAASVVLVSSTAGFFGEAGHADYAAAKAAMAHGLTLSLKNEIVTLAPLGRVNCIGPGWTHTPMAAEGLANEALIRRVLSTAALKKIATADDIAASIVFLLSTRLAGHITGAVLPIAGGMEGRRLDAADYDPSPTAPMGRSSH